MAPLGAFLYADVGRTYDHEQLSRPVDEDLLGGFGLGVFGGSFDELAGLEVDAGPDERDEVRGVDRAPAVLGGLDVVEHHRQPAARDPGVSRTISSINDADA